MYAVRDGHMLKSLVPLPDAHSTLYGDFAALFEPSILTPGTDRGVVVSSRPYADSVDRFLDCDCILVGEDPPVTTRACRCILAARSAFFGAYSSSRHHLQLAVKAWLNSPTEGAFASSFAESYKSRVQIELSEPAFARLIAYCYTNRIAPPTASLPSREVLYELAEASEFFAYVTLCVCVTSGDLVASFCSSSLVLEMRAWSSSVCGRWTLSWSLTTRWPTRMPPRAHRPRRRSPLGLANRPLAANDAYVYVEYAQRKHTLVPHSTDHERTLTWRR